MLCAHRRSGWAVYSLQVRASSIKLREARNEYYSSVTSDEIARLRLACVRAAYECGRWDVAHSQMRMLCQAAP